MSAMILRRSGTTAAILIAALAAGPARAADAPLTDVSFAVPNVSLTFTANYLAEDLGLFTKHGLRVKSIEISGVGTINAVISGSTDFGETSATSLTRAAAHGQRMLAIIEPIDRPVVQIVLRKEIATAAGFDPTAPLAKRGALLRGRTIAVAGINSIVHAYVRLIASRAGFNPEEVRVTSMDPDNMLGAFQVRQIDGFAMSPPWPEKPVLEGTAVMIASGPDGDPSDMAPFANNVIVAKPDTCVKRRAICAGMGQAFAEAIAYMHAHPAETAALMQKRFAKLDGKLVTKSVETITKISPNPPAPTRQAIENAEVFNIDAGLMKPEEKLSSYEGLYSDEFVR